MRRSPRTLSTILLVACAAQGAPARCASPDAPSLPPARVERAERDLLSGSPEARKAAEEILAAAPPRQAFAAVARCARSDKLETAARARRILSRWEWPTPELVESARELPSEIASPLLADALAQPAPVEMDALEADLLAPERHLRIQEGVFAAIRALSALPKDRALADLETALADADRPVYYTLRAAGAIGGERAAGILRRFEQEESTSGWVAVPALARLGRGEPLARLLASSERRIARMEKEGRPAAVHAYNHACLLVLAGRAAEAPRWLELSFKSGRMNATWARIDPDFDAVREEAWFKELLTRYGGFGLPGKEERR